VLTFLDIRKLRARPLVTLAILLTQLLGGLAPHTDHAHSSAAVELGGGWFQPSACHPRQAAHVEAAGPERAVQPCAACLHLLQSIGFQQAHPSASTQPDPVALVVATTLVPRDETTSFASSRAPPPSA